jgi:hypothetical protein
MIYDPIKSRNSKLSDNQAMLRFVLDTVFDEKRPMGNVAISHVNSVISASLAGLYSELQSIIGRTNLWLDQAIERDEDFDVNRDLHRSYLEWARAIGTWLENGSNDEGHWDRARVRQQSAWRFEGRPWSRNEIIKSGLDDYMAFAYQGGEHDDGFEAGIDIYEHWIGEKPLSLKKMLKPREFGYALCLHRARGQFHENELFDAGKKMLQANLEEVWLGGGQYLRAATWLKIVYWDRDQALSPLETILKAYDNMPNVPRPDFI